MSLCVFTLKMAKIPELKTILGRCISVVGNGEFFVSFYKTGAYFYVYDNLFHETRFLANLLPQFFESYSNDRDGLTFTTDKLLDIFRSIAFIQTVYYAYKGYRNRGYFLNRIIQRE